MQRRWIRVVIMAVSVTVAAGQVFAEGAAFEGGWGRGLGRGQNAMDRGRWVQPESQEWRALADEAERRAAPDPVPRGGDGASGRVDRSGVTDSGSSYRRDDPDLAGAEDRRVGRDDASDLADRQRRWPMGYGRGLWRNRRPRDYETMRGFHRGDWPSGPMCYGRAFGGQRQPMRRQGCGCGYGAWRGGNGWRSGRGAGCGFGRGCGYLTGAGLGRGRIDYGRGFGDRGRWPGMGFGRAGGGWLGSPVSYGRGAGGRQGIGYGPGRGYDYGLRQGDDGWGAGRRDDYGFGRGAGRRGGGYGLGRGFGRQAGRAGRLGGDGRGRRLPMLATATTGPHAQGVRAAMFLLLGGVGGVMLTLAVRKRPASDHPLPRADKS